jgi:hypothetical protein
VLSAGYQPRWHPSAERATLSRTASESPIAT